MFTDGRRRRVIFAAHCFLNQNSISDGTAVYPASFKGLISLMTENEIGIVQMPCPELMCLGLDRGNPNGADSPVTVENTRIRRAMLEKDKYARLEQLADSVIFQILEYRKHGFEILGIVGANRSPNCGVETTSDNNEEVSGKGLFMDLLAKKLSAHGITIPMTGIKSDEDIPKIKDLLK